MRQIERLGSRSLPDRDFCVTLPANIIRRGGQMRVLSKDGPHAYGKDDEIPVDVNPQTNPRGVASLTTPIGG